VAYIRELSPKAEFSIVIFVAFGYFIFNSLVLLITSSSSVPISEDHLRFLIIYELITLAVLGAFLFVRGWRLQQLGFVPSVKDTGVGFGLALVAYIAYVIVWLVAASFLPSLAAQAKGFIGPGLNLTTILAVSLVNPIFEELFVCGYIISSLRKTHSASFAINVSVGIRLAYHLYQGELGVIGMVPLGLIFAYWFAKTNRLWPIIVAHGLFDFLSLMPYT
jgi:uncharacterized protein